MSGLRLGPMQHSGEEIIIVIHDVDIFIYVISVRGSIGGTKGNREYYNIQLRDLSEIVFSISCHLSLHPQGSYYKPLYDILIKIFQLRLTKMNLSSYTTSWKPGSFRVMALVVVVVVVASLACGRGMFGEEIVYIHPEYYAVSE